jgi:hypothetical protein
MLGPSILHTLILSFAKLKDSMCIQKNPHKDEVTNQITKNINLSLMSYPMITSPPDQENESVKNIHNLY